MTIEQRFNSPTGFRLVSCLAMAALLLGTLGCPQPEEEEEPPPEEENEVENEGEAQNKEVVEEAIEIITAGEVDRLDEVVHPDFYNHHPAPDYASDLEGLRQQVADIHQAFSPFDMTIEDTLAEDDRVAVRVVTDFGTFEDEYLGIEPTGEEVTDIEGIAILRLEDEMIIERWAYSDQLLMMQQLGAMDPPEEAEAPEEPEDDLVN